MPDRQASGGIVRATGGDLSHWEGDPLGRYCHTHARAVAVAGEVFKHDTRGIEMGTPWSCSKCGMTFIGVKGFDAHRTGKYTGDAYPRWRKPMSESSRAQLKAARGQPAPAMA